MMVAQAVRRLQLKGSLGRVRRIMSAVHRMAKVGSADGVTASPRPLRQRGGPNLRRLHAAYGSQ